MQLSYVLVVLCLTALATAEITPRFPPTQPVSWANGLGTRSGSVLPCDTDYWRISPIPNPTASDYLVIEFNQRGETRAPADIGKLYIISSPYTDLQAELTSNANIVDTLGGLPGPSNFKYSCAQAKCIFEINCELNNGTYYMAITGGEAAINTYNFTVTRRSLNVTALQDRQPVTMLGDSVRRVLNELGYTNPIGPSFPDRSNYYRFFSIDVPQTRYSEGTYMIVNISRALPADKIGALRLFYGALPFPAADKNLVNGAEAGETSCIYPSCVDTRLTSSEAPYSTHPVRSQPRVPCECTPFAQELLDGRGSLQLTCNVTVDPCAFKYGTWYIGIALPPSNNLYNTTVDYANQFNYTIGAVVVQPRVVSLFRNVTFKGFVEPEAASHYKIVVPESSYVAGQSHFFVQVSNIRGGTVDIFVHSNQGIGAELSGREGCVPANTTCRTSDACNLVIEKCHFTPGTWYISIEIVYDAPTPPTTPSSRYRNFLVPDLDRLPVTYTVRATWLEDATPQVLLAGVPVHKFIGEALYDFYVINVPATIDTWLFVELYTQCTDTEVLVSMLHGAIPGGECYERPDFYCMTGDPRHLQLPSGNPLNVANTPPQREACSFMIQTCELEAGPLYISVYGHHTGYSAYPATPDTTYYQQPVHYTLWVDFDVALSIDTGVSYSENVFEKQYQHYYIRADNVNEGSSMSVEVTNIQHGIPQSLEVFVNYNYLAGNCPCYDHLYNCTGARQPACNGMPPSTAGNFIPSPETIATCCTILVPPCDFRSGVWYVAVLGVNENRRIYSTPIGYTLTVTINDAPVVKPLLLGQAAVGEAAQWNQTNAYSHYRLAAHPLPLHDLVIKLTYVQNCEYLPKHDNLRDTLSLFVNSDSLATADCMKYTCNARIASNSYCTIVVPHCDWSGDNWFVSVQGNFDAVFPGRFTLRASVEEVRDTQLVDGVAVYGRAPAMRYQHYFIEVPAEGKRYLQVDIYTNADQDRVSAYLQVDQRAGAGCFSSLPKYQCTNECFCSFQIEGCQLKPARYFVSVYGVGPQFYDISVEYTLLAALRPTTFVMSEGDPVTGSVLATQTQHYQFTVSSAPVGSFLLFEIDNVKNGMVASYINYNGLAGRCSNCGTYGYLSSCVADSAQTLSYKNWCELRVPTCQLNNGTYYFSVVGLQAKAPAILGVATPIGYTIEVNVINPEIIAPRVQVDRQEANRMTFQYIANNRFKHYQVNIANTDFTAGFHVIVEISNIREGALFAYYNPSTPADSFASCQVARICSTANMGTGGSCTWQMPYCLTRPGLHYITIEGVTGRLQASFDILIWLQRPAALVANPAFFGLTAQRTNSITPTNEVSIVHTNTNQPNGWVQFIRLTGVTLNDADGDILELFFYRINNNPGESTDFEVYLNPFTPAGPHKCCPTNVGGCQGLPCASHVLSTTRMLGDSYGSEYRANRYLCGGSPTAVNATSPAGFEGFRCNVTVWGCEFAAAQNSGTPIDWWVTVIPVAAAAHPGVMSPYRGLSYSMQWRVRNTRVDAAGNTASTTSLNTALNAVTTANVPIPTQFFSIGQYEDYRSFAFDITVASGTRQRVVVQSEFGTGTAANSVVVYIRKGKHANPDTCNDPYVCPTPQQTTNSCACNGRYVSNSCCTTSTRYYITVRDLLDAPGNVTVRFTITSLTEPATITIPTSPSIGAPYRYTGMVEGENYRHFRLPIATTDLATKTSLVVILQKTDTTDGSTLSTYVRAGDLAGRSTRFADNLLPPIAAGALEDCYYNQYSCSATGALVNTQYSNSGRCVLQIPQCQLYPSDWYISVSSDTFFPAAGPDASCTRYVLGRHFNLTVYFDPQPLLLTLGQTHVVSTLAPVGLNAPNMQTYVHYRFVVTASDIAYDPLTNTQGYYTRFLRVELANITLGAGSMYLNYDELAGQSTATTPCLGNYASARCVTTSGTPCTIDVLPCNGIGSDSTSQLKLVPGTYYASTAFTPVAAYSIRARILTNAYEVLTGTVVSGTGHRTGTNNVVYTAEPTVATRQTATIFRYVVDTKSEMAPFDGRDYLIANLTVLSNDAAPAVSLTMWRDDCNLWSCNVNTLNGSCVIDAVELASCSAQRGRYYFKVVSAVESGTTNTAIGFRLNFYHNTTTTAPLINRQVVTEMIYPHEYQEYYYVPVNISHGTTMNIKITAACGDVEAWINRDKFAGPTHSSTQGLGQRMCALDYCRTQNGASLRDITATSSATCDLYLDTCNIFSTGTYWIAIRGVQTSFPAAANTNLYLPIKYQITLNQVAIAYQEVAARTTNVVSYTAAPTSSPMQYVYNLESFQPGAYLRFSLRTPTKYVTSFASSRLWVNRNAAVAYSTDCPTNTGGCTVGTDGTCSIVISPCLLGSNPSSWFIVADAPRGSEVLVERLDIPVVNVHTAQVVHSTIGAVSDSPNFQLPFVSPRQYYRVNFDASQSTFNLRVRVFDVSQGTVSVYIHAPAATYWGPIPVTSGCAATPYSNTRCAAVDSANPCDVRVSQCDVRTVSAVDKSIKYTAKTVFITVAGVQQQCPLHSIKYSLLVTEVEDTPRLPINSPTCGVVTPAQYQFYRVSPRDVEVPQTSVVRLMVEDVGINAPQEVYIALRDQGLPTVSADILGVSSPSCNSVAVRSQWDIGNAYVDWICPYTELFASVYGVRDATSPGTAPINYRLTAKKTAVPVTTLSDNVPLVFDNSYARFDDDAWNCPGRYFFRIAAAATTDSAAYLQVTVTSTATNTAMRVYLNRNGFADSMCSISTCSAPTLIANTNADSNTQCQVADFCGFVSTNYYVTVYSNEGFSIVSRVRQDSTPLTLGATATRASLASRAINVYSVQVPDNVAPDARLVIEASGISHGTLFGTALYGRIADPATGATTTSCRNSAFTTMSTTINAGVGAIVIPSCNLKAGTYYVSLSTVASGVQHCDDVSYNVRAYVASYGITATPLKVDGVALTSQTISADLAATADSSSNAFVRYYKISALQQNGRAFAEVRIANVQGGEAVLYVKKARLALPVSGYFPGDRRFLSTSSATTFYGAPNTAQAFLSTADLTGTLTNQACADQTAVTDTRNFYSDAANSAQIWVDSCTWAYGDFYAAVTFAATVEDTARTVSDQTYLNVPLTFDIYATEYADWVALSHDTEVTATYAPVNGIQSRFYSVASGVKSLVVRTKITAGQGVMVDVYDSPCPSTATYHRALHCTIDSFDGLCDVEIPTVAAHPSIASNATFYIVVTGNNATFHTRAYVGRENCHDFSEGGRADSLSFCAALIPHAVWRWSDYTRLDREARGFFENLYDHFRVQPCWSGVTPECNATLARFACYESFPRCDQNGFYVATCRKACEAVAYECVNHFESVGLEYYNCSSSRYLDDSSQTCTGHYENTLEFNNNPFLNDVDNILFIEPEYQPQGHSSSSSSSSSSAATALTPVVSLVFVAVFAALATLMF
jgi:hypothetical protein